ncbi:MAG TPA: glycosyltransferase family 1 protein [Candidatus Saccharimonadales bacterium]|nr:glycosyltransferase family 1 protein [Candidatus Saccharimonadales bacterium]
MSNKSTIWVDLTHLLNWEGRFTGIERLEYNVAKHLAKLPRVKFFSYNQSARAFNELPAETLHIFADGYGGIKKSSAPRNVSLLNKILPMAKKIAPRKVRTFIKKNLMINDAASRLVVPHPFIAGDTVFVAATFSDVGFLDNLIELKKNAGVKLTYLVHDIIPIVRPNYVKQWDTDHFSTYYSRLMPAADKILAVSKSTKNDLLEFCESRRIVPPSIEVIHEGGDFNIVKNPVRPAELGKIKDFLLCVGTFEVRKNYTILYYAYKQAVREGIKLPPIVLVGRTGWLVNDIQHIISKDPEVKDLILHFDSIDDKGLAWVFKNCMFTVQPSFYEGWGLPVDESLHYGKLCLSSDASSLPEVGQDFTEYFSPFDSRECMEKIAYFASHPSEVKKREEKIAKKYKPVSWQQSAQQIYEKIS